MYMLFGIGDLAVYPAHGVGKIEAIEERKLSGEDCRFFIMRILGNDMKIMIPAHNINSVGLRPVIKKSEIEKLYSVLKTPAKISDASNWNRRHRDYLDKLKTGSVFDVAMVLNELLTMKSEKELSFGERKLLDTAKSLLIKEISIVEKLSEQDIEKKINGFFNIN